MLLFAALMKGVPLLDSAVTPGAIPDDWWLSLAAAGGELFLGVWLLFGVFPRVGRFLALVTFAGFAGVAILKAIRGEASCGCLGPLHVNPKYMAAFDLSVILAICSVGGGSKEQAGDGGGGSRMDGGLLLAGTFVLVVGLGLTAYARATALSRGLLVRGSAVHEFGEVQQGERLTHEFTVENTCAFPVEVVSTSSNCGCTTVKGLEGQRVDPGGSLNIPVTLHTKDSEDHLVGAVTLYCRRAGSASPPTLLRKLQVAGKVEPDYWVRPLIVDFDKVDHERPVTGRIRLRTHRMPDARITRVESDHPAFTARLLEERSPEGDQQLEVSFTGRNLTARASVESRLTIHTNSPRRPAVDALVKAYFLPPVTVEPQAIVIASDEHGEMTREVVVVATHPIQVEVAEATLAKVRAEAREVAATEWRVRVVLPDDAEQGSYNGSVRITVRPANPTAAAEARGVTIPLHRLHQPRKRGSR